MFASTRQQRNLPLSIVALALVIICLVCSGQGQVSPDSSQVCLTHFAKFSRNHTACLKPNQSCRITEAGLSSRDQKLIVDVHNYYRNLIASGNETRLGFPSAANMLKMEWDPELAYVAQMHANQCEFSHDCYDCRKTEHHDTVGQNLYIYQTSHSSVDTQWQYVVKEWYDEIKIAPPVVAQSFDLFNLNIGHFTQIAWASTNRVGCGIVTYDVSGGTGENAIFKTAQLYTCNYAPGGNFLGEKMYEDGHSASQCPTRYSRSKRFTALCEYSRVKVNKVAPVPKKKKVTKPKKTVTPPANEVAVAPSNWPISSTDSTHFVPSSQAPSPPQQQQPPTRHHPIITSSIVAFTPSSISSSVLFSNPTSFEPASQPPPPSSDIPSSSSAFNPSSEIPSSVSFVSTNTRRVTHKVKTTKPTKKPTKKKQQAKPVTAVTQTSKRVTNWWDKWSENFAKTWSATSTTRAPTWKNQWTWNWSTTSNRPNSNSATTNGGTTRIPFIKMEMTQNGNLTQRINQPI